MEKRPPSELPEPASTPLPSQEGRAEVTRREFLQVTAIASAALALDAAGCAGGGASEDPDAGPDMTPDAGGPIDDLARSPWVFAHGVASGDPLFDRVILWTRVSGATADVEVSWEVARDVAFGDRVAQGTGVARAADDFTFKVDALLPSPATTYFYRFRALGTVSAIGRTRTAPVTSEQIRIAVVSCSSIWSGFMNAYDRIAARDDLDLVIHCGDYIYDYADEQEQVLVPRDPVDMSDPIGLAGMRRRYAYYRRDPSMRRVHQQHPWAIVWDNHDLALDGDRADAIRAFHEWTPTRAPEPGRLDRIHRSLPHGNLLDVLMLDTRHIGRDTAFDSALPVDGTTNLSLLGREQWDWLAGELERSTATWRVLGNQVMMAPMLLAGAQLAGGKWPGYPEDRDRLLRFLRDHDLLNTVVVTGDAHLTFASDLEVDGEHAGVEILPTSVSRGNLDETVGSWLAGIGQVVAESVLGVANPHFRYHELASHGYGILDVRPARVMCEVWFTPIDRPTADETLAAQLVCHDGWGRLEPIASPTPTAGPSRPRAPAALTAFSRADSVGGDGGAWFDDERDLPEGARLARVSLRAGERLDQVSLAIEGGPVLAHGGTGGTSATLVLDAGEHVVRVTIDVAPNGGDDTVHRLEVRTSRGRTLVGGLAAGVRYVFDAPLGTGLVGFHGRASTEIDRLGPIFGPTG